MLSSTGYLGLDEPRKGWRAILPPGFCALLLGGRRQKEFHQSVAQLCDRGSVTSSLWASASSLMNRPDWHLFLEVVKGMSPSSPGLALRASTADPFTRRGSPGNSTHGERLPNLGTR